MERFAEINEMPNVLQYPPNMKGRWAEHFGNANAITLELACGKGEYTVGLAEMYTDRNFIGVDLKGNRIWVGAKKALKDKLKNAAFLRTHIDMIAEYFAPQEVAEIWITFPDPHLRNSKAKKRLTHPIFLRKYQKILQKNGLIHLKTDSPNLYAFTKLVIDLYGLNLLTDEADVYGNPEMPKELTAIQTHYEKMDIARSNKVHYLCFQINKELPEELDVELKNKVFELFASAEDRATIEKDFSQK
ncbi:MAG TPA: tRNA (guanosine(46)-N7)-methyltransferase TrmB [Parasegetibacter sp.]